MWNFPRPLRTAALVSPFLLFALFSFALARDFPITSGSDLTQARSHREITIKLTLPNERTITVSQYDGQMIRTGREGEEIIGIMPRVLEDGSVALEFFRIWKIMRRNSVIGESVASAGSITFDGTTPQAAPIDRVSTVQLISVSKPSEMRITDSEYGQCPCCVTCNGEETCGLAVNLQCGSCRCRPQLGE